MNRRSFFVALTALIPAVAGCTAYAGVKRNKTIPPKRIYYTTHSVGIAPQDKVPAMLTPGEFVICKKFRSL